MLLKILLLAFPKPWINWPNFPNWQLQYHLLWTVFYSSFLPDQFLVFSMLNYKIMAKSTLFVKSLVYERNLGLFQATGRFTLVRQYQQGMVWNGRRFFHIPYWQFSSIPFPFHAKNLPFHTKFSSIFHSILPYQRTFTLEAMQRIFCTIAML